ncbi:MAG TPA: uroporphyrinogen-III synthase [Gaiellaceae bacterium]|nr:uroporphyrinogen-III synthase [Gaiellaceae bacterium]
MKVMVTRPRGQADGLVARLRSLSVEVVECPLIEIEPLSADPFDGGGYDWVIVTSPNGASELARRGRNLPRIAAVGPATAQALRDCGLEPAFVPGTATQEALIAELPRPAGRVLFAAAEGARRGPVEELGADFLPLYRTRLLRPAVLPAVDLVVLASGSAALAYAEAGGAARAVTIGPETSRVAREAGIDVVREATTHDVEGLVAAVRDLMEFDGR